MSRAKTILVNLVTAHIASCVVGGIWATAFWAFGASDPACQGAAYGAYAVMAACLARRVFGEK